MKHTHKWTAFFLSVLLLFAAVFGCKYFPANAEPLVKAPPILVDGVPVETVRRGDTLYLSREGLAEQYADPYIQLELAQGLCCLAYYESPVTHQQYLTSGGGDWVIPGDAVIPILEYHGVSDDIWGSENLFVSPTELEQQLAYLIDHGYEPIWFEDLSHLSDYEKPVILTFDDGYEDNYTVLFPLLQKYQVKATFFVITGHLGGPHTMGEEQIREISRSGLVSVQSHGYSHRTVDTLSQAELTEEFEKSREILCRITGKIPCVFSYPEGIYTAQAVQTAKQYYKFGTRTTQHGWNTGKHPLYADRYDIPRGTSLAQFAALLQANDPGE